MRPIRPLVIVLTVLVGLGLDGGRSPLHGQTFGFSTEPLLPFGKFAKAADIGWGFTGYYSLRLGRKSPWAILADVGGQWHAGNSVDPVEFPDSVPLDPSNDGDEVALSGWMFPLRVSLTRILGTAYISPRVGLYIPVGETASKLGMESSFGFSPRVGHLFFVSRDLTADIGIEYTLIFDRETIHFLGVGFGFLFGGDRLPRRRLPY